MKLTALAVASLVALVACGPSASISTTTTTRSGAPTTTTSAGSPTSTAAALTTIADTSFPVTVTDDLGTVTIEERPESIVSLSAVATEMLFEIGAGPQVVAVDDQSNYPDDAPRTDLSGFTPNLEAILAYQPDLVVVAYEPGELVSGLRTARVPVIFLNAASAIDDVYGQIRVLGAATGNVEAADATDEGIRSDLETIVEQAGSAGDDTTYYHEIDSTLYTVTSSTFFGEIYGLFGMVNIADAADEDGSAGGYPQLSSEYVVSRDPDIIFLSDTAYGESAATVSQRPGWDAMAAVRNGAIVELDSDIASRWGPRIVDLADSIAKALGEHARG